MRDDDHDDVRVGAGETRDVSLIICWNLEGLLKALASDNRDHGRYKVDLTGEGYK